MSCLLCCFKTFSFCGLRDYIVSTLAFRPPKEQKYEVKQIESEDPKTPPRYRLALLKTPGNNLTPDEVPGVECSTLWLHTKTNKKIPALFFFNKSCKNNFVIMYSHANATNLAVMRPYLMALCFTLGIHVFAYEYSGYGPAKGNAKEMEVIFNAIAAYEELTQRMMFKWTQIILYGRSIGTGPTLYLASHPKYPVSGVILHSPIASGLRMFNINLKKTDKKDLFPNSDMIEHVKAPVFIMHGQDDEDVPISHAQLLSSKCTNLFAPWWVPEGTHNDLDLKFRRTYFLKLSRFIKHVKDHVMRKTDKQLDEMYRADQWHNTFDHMYFKNEKIIEEKWKKSQKNNKPNNDNYCLIPGHSFMNTVYSYKNNTAESLHTIMDEQTTRRHGNETARTALDSERGMLTPECTLSKTVSERSALKETSTEIEFSTRFKASISKSETENAECARTKNDMEDNVQPTPSPEKADAISPYDFSFDNSQMVTDGKSANAEAEVNSNEVEEIENKNEHSKTNESETKNTQI